MVFVVLLISFISGPVTLTGQIPKKCTSDLPKSATPSFEDFFETRFLQAVARGQTSTVKVMLERDASHVRNLGNEFRTNPVLIAAYYGQTEILELLTKNGAKVDTEDCNGLGPLSFATLKGHIETVILLTKAGADVNKRSREGISPLVVAAMKGDHSIAEILLQKGANPNITIDTGTTVLMNAADNRILINQLLSYGADIEGRDRKGRTALFFAVHDGKIESVRTLLESGARIDVTSDDGVKIRDIVAQHNDPSKRKILAELVDKYSK
jgi:ankyrin repeat protein